MRVFPRHVRRFLCAGAIGLGLLPGVPAAQSAEPEPVNKGKVSLTAGTDFVTQYFFRGFNQEDSGVIAQPYAEVGVQVFESDGPLTGIKLIAGIWNSFHSKQTLGDSAWYEADLYAGATFGILGKVDLTALYYSYHYPNDAFNSIQEAIVKVAVNDSEWLGQFALAPYALVAIEFDDGNGTQDAYLELGITPGLTLNEGSSYPVRVDFPVVLGLSLDDYYIKPSGSSETFGYVSAGVTASLPLSFIPKDFGAWKLTAGVSFLFLGDSAEAFNNNDDFTVVGKLGVSMAY